MKNFNEKVATLVACLTLLFTACKEEENMKNVPDALSINGQEWMKENLDVTTFRNGDIIPEVTSEEEWIAAGENGEPAWCYYNNDLANGETKGKLYNWFAVNDSRGLAPEGWHVPTQEEWDTLIEFLGGIETAGDKLKSTEGWGNYEPHNGSNESGFSAIPNGMRDGLYGSFLNVEDNAYYWTATEINVNGAKNVIIYWDDELTINSVRKEDGFAIRCIRD